MGRKSKEQIIQEKNSRQAYFDQYRENKDGWKKNFDTEADALSRDIFANLFKKMSDGRLSESASIDQKSINIKLAGGTVNKYFTFDVMNNPNHAQPHDQAVYKEYLPDKNAHMAFYDLYHTIGNFAPIPRTIISKNFGPNLQMIHRYLNELWPWNLKFMKDNWKEFPTSVNELLSFEEYMTYTCQKMYYKDIFENVFAKNPKWDDLFNIIDEANITSASPLISFNEHFQSQEAIKALDEKIQFLIELRSRYIFNKLQKKSN